MTMLDRMRRHRNWLKWSLVLVVLAFVIFYIPDFLRGTGAVANGDAVAVVGGQEIRSEEFRRLYQMQLQQYRTQLGSQMNEQLLKQLGIDQQILAQLIDERAAVAEAERLGIKVTDQEVAQRIFAIPAFQENGAFIGAQRYQQVLASQPVPLSVSDFEESVRRSILADKLRTSLTEWMAISDKELEQEFRRRNDKVKLALVTFNLDSYRLDVTASDADVASYFDAHQSDFKIPEKRKIQYLLIDVDAMREKITISQQDLERAYNDNAAQYSTPEQIRASHILLKTDGKDDAAVKAQAEDILKQARAGADFAALAKKYSQDDSNAKNGGDLDFFGRGRMVPEFDAAAFALKPGEISDLVKTQFGYHIIKVTDKKGGITTPLAAVKDQLTEQLQDERAARQATDMAAALEADIKKPADLDRVAKARGLTVEETGFFAPNEPLLGLGSAPEVTSRAFQMNVGDMSGALRTGRGYVFMTVTGKQDPYIPKLDEVKDQVRDTVIRQRAREMSAQKAAEAVAKLKSAADFEKAAKAAVLEVQTTDFLTHDSPIPDLGQAPAVIDAAFSLPQGAVSDPITTDNGTAIIKVLEKQQASPADIAAAKETLRDELLNERRSLFFGSYMTKAKQNMKIQLYRDTIQRVVG
ncbi:MAG: peptidyl-prolyl cis-trans isomerase [Acidobacteriaceae bacterium]|jgi:peptidyl-prolyl cis-trans isomerase D|nr:peptidyl-prolyl cis-trans isomerase [Acidobacteriaceae bacterium]